MLFLASCSAVVSKDIGGECATCHHHHHHLHITTLQNNKAWCGVVQYGVWYQTPPTIVWPGTLVGDGMVTVLHDAVIFALYSEHIHPLSPSFQNLHLILHNFFKVFFL